MPRENELNMVVRRPLKMLGMRDICLETLRTMTQVQRA